VNQPEKAHGPGSVTDDVVQAHDLRLAALERRVDAMEKHPERRGLRAGARAPWDWSLLADSQLLEAWTNLASWFFEVARDHALEDKVPRCWYRHPGFVAHLAALKSWHDRARAPNASPADAVSWHEAFLKMAEMVWPRYAGHLHREEHAAESERQADREAVMAQALDQYLQEHAIDGGTAKKRKS
jgi:hypothetical protein